jgi:hypothetical protein
MKIPGNAPTPHSAPAMLTPSSFIPPSAARAGLPINAVMMNSAFSEAIILVLIIETSFSREYSA